MSDQPNPLREVFEAIQEVKRAFGAPGDHGYGTREGDALFRLYKAQVTHITQAARDVLTERQRQISAEGWTPEHDDEHDDGALPMAAASYAVVSAFTPMAREIAAESHHHSETLRELWPWADGWWKPTTRRRDLVKAAALILAEIERLDRAEARGDGDG